MGFSHRQVGVSFAALAIVFAAKGASAGGIFGDGRIVEETALVTWDDASKVEHLITAASALSADGALAYAFTTPEKPVDSPFPTTTRDGFAKLAEGHVPFAPLTDQGHATAQIAPAGSLSSWLETLRIDGPRGVDRWTDAVHHAGKDVVVVPFIEGAKYAHVRFETPFPVVPFADPPAGDARPEVPPLPDDEHPPRVTLFAEIGIETKHGTFERAFDVALAKLEKPVADCYAEDLAKNQRLSGDVHATIRVPVVGPVSVEDKSASQKALTHAATCLAEALVKAEFPRPDERAAPIEVHATLKPPRARQRVLRAFVLAPSDLEPRLGTVDDARVPPDTRVAASFEPSRAELTNAFDDASRAALGLEVSRRYRFVVIESTADSRNGMDDIALRPLDPLPAPKVGETPVPIIERGDRPEGAVAEPPGPNKRRKRWRMLGGGLAVALLVAGVLYFELRSRRARDAARDLPFGS